MELEYKPIEWIEGNKISLALPLQKVEITPSGKVVSDYVPDGTIEVVIKSTFKIYKYTPTLDGNLCIFSDNGTLRQGIYAIEILSTEADGTKRRSQYPRVIIVHKDSTSLLEPFEDFPDYAEGAVLDTASVFYFAKGDKGDQGLSAYEVAVKNGYSGTEEEWLASLKGDEGDSAYEVAVRNGYVGTEEEWLASLHGQDADMSQIYTKTESDERYVQKENGKGLSTNDYTDTEKQKLSQLQNYDDSGIRWMIQNVQASLANYYTKSETYSRSQVDNMIAAIGSMEIIPVPVLPTPSANTLGKIYLVPSSSPTTGNTRDENITIQNGSQYQWEMIGSADVSLDGYVTDEELQTALASYYQKPSGGIPASDMDSSVQAALGKANTALQSESDPTVPSWAKQPTKPTYTAQEVGAYVKPTTGIPSTDLSSAVQTSLGKANTALQSETDPTVPSWAKQSSKPSYTASEVGAVPTTRKVNGKALSSDVTLDASDVGALPSSTPIPVVPTKVSAFTNDAGYLTSHQDISGKEDKVVSFSG